MEYKELKLDNQICFPLYVVSKEVIRRYKPFLDGLGVTYTQYITLMVLWERKKMNVKQLGELLFLDSGTLTPLLKKLEKNGYVSRERDKIDERNVIVCITKKGLTLRKNAKEVPNNVAECMEITSEDASDLFRILRKVMKDL
ncbi:MarR family winged helix-turn-helix transcriptional regulator [Mycoplasma sp. P36-A1]|uniref:MarR family winged helix-turn-helix transcriptional regulator n=1 Tax=Mycoplasma sp. P36-A1 TaxID=3252900 RepID=UPI003C2F0BCC